MLSKFDFVDFIVKISDIFVKLLIELILSWQFIMTSIQNKVEHVDQRQI